MKILALDCQRLSSIVDRWLVGMLLRSVFLDLVHNPQIVDRRKMSKGKNLVEMLYHYNEMVILHWIFDAKSMYLVLPIDMAQSTYKAGK
jgi:hypothetical protein